MQVKGVEVHVKEMVYCARCSWGSDIHAECIPPVPARQLHVEDAVKHQLPPSLALLVEQWRAKMLAREQCHGLVRCVILSVGHQEARAYCRIIEGKLLGTGSDFLEMNNIGKLGSLQDVIEDELGACNGPGLDIPRCEA